MNTYLIDVTLRVSVEAFDISDAHELVTDCFGEGDFCGVEVQDCELNDFELLA